MSQTVGDDLDMAAEVRARTDAGYRWLIESVAPQVKGLLARKFGRQHHDILDTAIVNAAESLWMKGEPYDPKRGTVLNWLYIAAARNCVSLFRAMQVRPLIASLPEPKLEEALIQNSPVRGRSDRVTLLLEDLRQSIESLSPREQEIIYAQLSRPTGTDAELGKELGTSDNVVRVTRCRALRKLAKLMQEKQQDE